MTKCYDKAMENLVSRGWIKNNAGCLQKGKHELVFDTSSCVEIYSRLNGKRVCEFPLRSEEDLTQLLHQLNQIGQYNV